MTETEHMVRRLGALAKNALHGTEEFAQQGVEGRFAVFLKAVDPTNSLSEEERHRRATSARNYWLLRQRYRQEVERQDPCMLARPPIE